MADPIAVIRAALVAAAPVTALVSDRISTRPLAQGEPLPTIDLQVISTIPAGHLQGDGLLDEVRVQVACNAATSAGAKTLSDAVRAALYTAEQVLVAENTDYDPTTEAHIVFQDYLLWIHPTA